MTTDILLVSCAKHFPWLRFALKSIDRFAKGFRKCVVLIPSDDLTAMNPILGEFSDHFGIPIRVRVYDDWPGKGFLAHEYQIMCADQHTDADFILHTDSDCLFVEPFSPQDYFVDGRPVLMHGSYHWLKTEVQANLDMWRDTVEKAIGGEVTQEIMRRHPGLYSRNLYPKARECIEQHTGKSAAEYIHSCENAYPQTFCEHNTLGAVAWRHFHDQYSWLDHEQLHKTNTPWPNSKLVQFWSHASPDEPQEPVFKGKPYRCTPKQLLAEV